MGRTTLAMTIFSRNQDSTCILYNESNVSANRHNKLIFLPFIFATCQKNSQIIWTCTLLLLNNFNATVTVTTTSRTTTTTTRVGWGKTPRRGEKPMACNWQQSARYVSMVYYDDSSIYCVYNSMLHVDSVTSSEKLCCYIEF